MYNQKEWREKNKEKLRIYDKRYKTKHKDKVKENHRKWNLSHRKYLKEYRKTHREKILLALRKWQNKILFGGNRTKVLGRDKYTCQGCGKTHHETIIDVHHKDGKGLNSKRKNNNLDNLITLCRSCHIKRHMQILYNKGDKTNV